MGHTYSVSLACPTSGVLDLSRPCEVRVSWRTDAESHLNTGSWSLLLLSASEVASGKLEATPVWRADLAAKRTSGDLLLPPTLSQHMVAGVEYQFVMVERTTFLLFSSHRSLAVGPLLRVTSDRHRREQHVQRVRSTLAAQEDKLADMQRQVERQLQQVATMRQELNQLLGLPTQARAAALAAAANGTSGGGGGSSYDRDRDRDSNSNSRADSSDETPINITVTMGKRRRTE